MIKCLSSKLIHENEYMRVYDNLIIQDSKKKYIPLSRGLIRLL